MFQRAGRLKQVEGQKARTICWKRLKCSSGSVTVRRNSAVCSFRVNYIFFKNICNKRISNGLNRTHESSMWHFKCLQSTKTEARFTSLFSRYPSESLLSRFAHKAFGSYLSKTVASCMLSCFPEVRYGLRWWCKWFLLTEIVAVRDGGGMRMEWVVTWIQMEPVPERRSAYSPFVFCPSVMCAFCSALIKFTRSLTDLLNSKKLFINIGFQMMVTSLCPMKILGERR